MPEWLNWGIAKVMTSEERLARQLDRSLAGLPGELGRVVYLASLRDSYSGRYVHEGLASVGDESSVHAALLERHVAAFTNASALSIDSLCEQLLEHFASLSQAPMETAKMWMELEPFREVFPRGASELEREFFLSQMRAALSVLVALKLGVPLEPNALPPPPLGPPLRPHRDADGSAREPGTWDEESK